MRRAVEVIDFFDPEVTDAQFERWRRDYYGIPDPARFTAPRTSLKKPAVQRERERQAAEDREAAA